jgi:hypothetical protein
MCVDAIAGEHCRRNRSTRDRWDTMASHRAWVMRLISDARGHTGRSLCVLGAGNANDVDLAQLACDFERIALVDIDQQALDRACGQLPEAARARIERRGQCDLTGILPMLSSWQKQRPPADSDVSEAIAAARCATLLPMGEFDVVASTCVLSQLIDSIYLALAPDQPRCVQLVMAVRDRHLELIVHLLKPGGAGVLVTDFVSSETAPGLTFLDDRQLPAAAARWINERNFFTGANPYAIRNYLQGLPTGCPPVENVRVSPAWRWDIGAKQLAVSAVTFRRRG